MKLSAILVDDMPGAIKVLQSDLEEMFPDLEILGTADSVVNAAKLLRNQSPDILFLDIMLGDGTGFDILEIFPKLASKVIFTTAYEEHAIKAFRFAAVDYLLKPINPEELRNSVEKVEKQLLQSNENISILKDTFNNPDILPTKISLHTQERIIIVNIDEIVRCEADSNNTIFVLNSGQKIFVTKTLKQYERLLSEHNFFRTHQSHLINIDYIQAFVRKDGGYLLMKNKDMVSVSVRKRSEMMELLDNLK